MRCCMSNRFCAFWLMWMECSWLNMCLSILVQTNPQAVKCTEVYKTFYLFESCVWSSGYTRLRTRENNHPSCIIIFVLNPRKWCTWEMSVNLENAFCLWQEGHFKAEDPPPPHCHHGKCCDGFMPIPSEREAFAVLTVCFAFMLLWTRSENPDQNWLKLRQGTVISADPDI